MADRGRYIVFIWNKYLATPNNMGSFLRKAKCATIPWELRTDLSLPLSLCEMGNE